MSCRLRLNVLSPVGRLRRVRAGGNSESEAMSSTSAVKTVEEVVWPREQCLRVQSRNDDEL